MDLNLQVTIWHCWLSTIAGRTTSSRMPGAMRILCRSAHWNVHRMCASSCWVSWIAISWTLCRRARIRCAYRRPSVRVSFATRPRRIHKRAIALWSTLRSSIYILRARFSIDNPNGSSTMNWCKQPRNICVKWLPLIPSGWSSLRLRSSASRIPQNSASSRRINVWSRSITNTRSQMRGVYHACDDDAINVHYLQFHFVFVFNKHLVTIKLS